MFRWFPCDSLSLNLLWLFFLLFLLHFTFCCSSPYNSSYLFTFDNNITIKLSYQYLLALHVQNPQNTGYKSSQVGTQVKSPCWDTLNVRPPDLNHVDPKPSVDLTTLVEIQSLPYTLNLYKKLDLMLYFSYHDPFPYQVHYIMFHFFRATESLKLGYIGHGFFLFLRVYGRNLAPGICPSRNP